MSTRRWGIFSNYKEKTKSSHSARCCINWVLILFDMGEGHDGPPKMFVTTVAKRLGGGSWNLMTFNVNLFSIKKSYFWFSMLSSFTMATSLSGSTRDFLKLSFHMFPYNEILNVLKSKIWFNIWRKHLKIPPNTRFYWNRLKYRLWRHNGVIVMTSHIFLLPLCRIHQAWHLCQISWSSEQQQQSYDAPPHDWRFKKSPCQIGLSNRTITDQFS